MIFRLLIFIILVHFTIPVFPQAPGVAWQKLFSGNEGDYSEKVIATSDGGSLIVGYTESGGRDIRGYLGATFAGDILVIKLDADGGLQWQRCLGGQNIDIGMSAAETADGFLIFGHSGSVDCQIPSIRGLDFYLAKLTKSGDIIWEKRYGGGNHEYGNAMTVDGDGNIYMVGNSQSADGDLTVNKGERDCWVLNVSATGDVIWQKSFGGSGDEGINGICVTNDGAVMVVGYTQLVRGDFSGGKGKTDAVVARLSAASGNIEWIKLYGGSEFDQFSTVIQLKNNSILIGGMTVSKDGDLSGLPTHPYGIDAWLVNVNAAGNINWKKVFAKEYDDHIQELVKFPDGSVAGTGYRSLSPNDPCTFGYHGGIWIFRLSDEGDIFWEKTIASKYDAGFASIGIAQDYSIIIAATANTTDIPGYYGNTSGANSSVGDVWAIKLQPELLTMPIFPPTFEIERSSAVICDGKAATIKTKSFNTGTRPRYRWKRNGTEVSGIYSTELTAADFKNGEVISCTISSGDDCQTIPFDITDQVTIAFKNGTIQPVVTISANTEYICGCAEIKFTASRVNGGSKSSFQWRKNGEPVGYNLPEFASKDLVNGDVITCDYSDDEACISGAAFVSSNSIIMKDNGAAQPASIRIAASPANPCTGGPVTLIATTANAGMNPVFEWKLNNQLLSFSNDTIILNDLKETDIILCILKSDASSSCIQADTVTSNELKINFSAGHHPTVQLKSASDTLCEGSTVTIQALPSEAGNTPAYKWFLNGNIVGTNSQTLVLNTVNDLDQVICRIYPDKSQICSVKDSVESSPKILYIRKKLPVTISINEIKNNVCQGEAIEMVAVHVNAGTSPEINWYVNNHLQTQNSSTLIFNHPKQGDLVHFILRPSPESCLPAELSSDSVKLLVKDSAIISINPADTTVAPKTVLQLNTQVSMQVQSFEWTPTRLLVSGNDLNPRTIALDDEAMFMLTVFNTSGCRSRAFAVVNIAFNFYMPNAFTPNGDGLNDIFRIPRQSRTGIRQFSIYNRWGRLIFQTTNPLSGWDGKINGQHAPAGVYTYLIKGENEKSGFQYKGSFVLIR